MHYNKKIETFTRLTFKSINVLQRVISELRVDEYRTSYFIHFIIESVH